MAEPEGQLRPAPPAGRDRATRAGSVGPLPTTAAEQPPPEPSRWMRASLEMLGAAERAVLVAVGVLLVAAAVLLLIDTVRGVWRISVEHGNLTAGLVNALGEVLLVVILMELLSTVVTFLRHGVFALRQFLVIGIVSSVRQILIVGAELAVGTHETNSAFVHAEVELAVSVGVILALSFALRIVAPVSDSRY